MAIKSKGRTKNKQRSVAKGPRHDPVPVPKPIAQRRWVQLVAIFIVGLFAMMVFVWATNGLRRDRANNQAASELITRQKSLSSWKTVVESQISAVGQLQGSAPPVLASDITAALQALAKGNDPTSKPAQLESSAAELGKAAKTIDTFDLAGTITEQGFDLAASTALTSSKDELVQALKLYQQAGTLAVVAMSADEHTKARLTTSAQAIADSASALLQNAWIKYSGTLSENQLSAGGTPGGTPGGLGSGFPGGGG
jgi:hypothetical protein